MSSFRSLHRCICALLQAGLVQLVLTSPLLGSWPVTEAGTTGQAMRVGGGFNTPDDNQGGAKQHTVAFDSLGNAYVVGTVGTTSNGEDILVVSYDRRGLERWRKTLNGTANQNDRAYAVAVDPAGNIYVAGMIHNSGTGGVDALLVSYDSSGALRWQALPTSTVVSDGWEDVAVDFSGNVYVTGWADDTTYHAGTQTGAYDASTGANRWLRSWRRLPDDGSDTVTTAIALDGSLVYVGGRNSVSGLFVAAYNPDPTISQPVWMDIPVSVYAQRVTAISAGGGRVVVSGVTGDAAGGQSFFSVGYAAADKTGRWERVLSRVPGSYDAAFGVVVDGSGNAFVTGKSAYPAGQYGCFTISYDAAGNERWRQSPDTGTPSACYAAALDGSGNVYVAGKDANQNGLLVASYTNSGAQRWQMTKRGQHGADYAAVGLAVSSSAVYASGSPQVNGYRDALTVTADLGGKELWSARTGDQTTLVAGDGLAAHGKHVLATDAAGNSYVAGRKSTDGKFDIYVVAYDPQGLKRWEKTLDGPAHGHDWGTAITVAPSGAVVVTGASEDAGHKLRYLTIALQSSDGLELWSPRLKASTGDAVPVGVVTDAAGNIFVTGSASNGANDDILTVVYSAAGAELYSATWDAGHNGDDRAADLAIDASSNVYITGSTYNGSNLDVVTLSYGMTLGALRWTEFQDGGQDDGGAAIAFRSGRLFVTGVSRSAAYGAECYIAAYDAASGNRAWQSFIGPEVRKPGSDAAGNAIAVNADGAVVVAGYMRTAGNQDLLLVMVNSITGSVAHVITRDVAGGAETGYAIAIDPLNNAFIAGSTDTTGWNREFFVVSYNMTGHELASTVIDSTSHGEAFAAAPRPGVGAIVTGTTNNAGPDAIFTTAYSFDPPVVTALTPLTTSAGGFATSGPLASATDPFFPLSDLFFQATGVPAVLTVGALTNNGGTASGSVAAACSAPATNTFTVQAKNPAGLTGSATVTVNVNANTAPTAGAYSHGPVSAGQTFTVSPLPVWADNGKITFALSASPNFAGTTISINSTGDVTVSNAGPGGSSVTITVTATDDCGRTASTSFTFDVTGYSAPPALSAKSNASLNAVDLSWFPSPNAPSYIIYRRNPPANPSWAPIAQVGAASQSYTDTNGIASDNVYVYYIVATDGSSTSLPSPFDHAVTAALPAIGPVTIQASHLTSIQYAINLMLAAAGQAPFSFTDPVAAGLPVRASQANQLCDQANVARLALFVPSYPCASVNIGDVIRQIDFTNRVHAVE